MIKILIYTKIKRKTKYTTNLVYMQMHISIRHNNILRHVIKSTPVLLFVAS